MIVQRFNAGEGGVYLVTRRRDGTTGHYMPEKYFRWIREHHVAELKALSLDASFTSNVLGEMDTDPALEQAVVAFNRANTDNPATSEVSELIDIVSAFQQFLGIPGGQTKATIDALEAAMACVPLSSSTSAKAGVVQRMAGGQKSLRAAWMGDLCVLRGSVGHGHAASTYKSLWSTKEHLLLAAFLFPLLVKLRMAQKGLRALSNEEKLGLGIFDLYLSSENAVREEDTGRGYAEPRWLSIRSNARYSVPDWNPIP